MQEITKRNTKAETADAVPANGNSHAESGESASAWDLGTPRLRYPLTADTLFRLAHSISAYDPARIALGYRYEFELKRECAITLEFPIYKNDLMGLWIVIWRRRLNWGFFRCSAVDFVLSAYWNMFTGWKTK